MAAAASASEIDDHSIGPTDGHLVLVGLPGSGKSTIGRAVSKVLGRPFLDFDLEIERRVGQTVANIFSTEGEPAFRDREVALTRELVAAPPMVLAPGGGWITNPGVVSMLRPPGRLVYLQISVEAALARLSRSRVVRPLLKSSDPRATLTRILTSRAPLYDQADLVLDVEVVDSQQVVDEVVALARNLTRGLG